MSRLVLTKELFERLQKDLFIDDKESCAILLGRSVEISGNLVRIVVGEYYQPPPEAYVVRTSVRAQLRPEYVGEIVQKAKPNNNSVVFVHTHPFPLNSYSDIDDDGERELLTFLNQRIPSARHASMLLTPQATLARELGQNKPLCVIGVGKEIIFSGRGSNNNFNNVYDRQARIFGREGQNILEGVRVGIVGLGGTGSVVLQQLAYLGFKDYLLIDPDVIEDTNLNRVIGAVHSDVGRSKVDVAAAWALRINPSIRIDKKQDSILKASVTRFLADTDIIFCCTDSHGSRAVLNQFAYQYFVPMIDMGVVIVMDQEKVSNIAGRVQLLAPGLACMACSNLLDPEQIRRDLLSDFERKADPYIVGHPEPAPAVVSLNSLVASFATTMFLDAVFGISGSARFINYDGIAGATRPAFCNPHPTCVVCSPSGALARCDEWPLPARKT